MLKEIRLAGSARKPFGSCCDGFADVSAVELGKASVERSGVKPEDVEELLVGKHPQRRPPPKRRAPDRDRGAETSSSLLAQLSFLPFPEEAIPHGDPELYGGKGVPKALANVEGEIAEAQRGTDVAGQRAIEERIMALDGTPNKSRLGAKRHSRRFDGRRPARKIMARVVAPFIEVIAHGFFAGTKEDWD
jgi:hypothetical protein